jgi:hypothetical protein
MINVSKHAKKIIFITSLIFCFFFTNSALNLVIISKKGLNRYETSHFHTLKSSFKLILGIFSLKDRELCLNTDILNRYFPPVKAVIFFNPK